MQNQHRINYQTSYFGNTVLYVVESVGYIADNVKRLCVRWGFPALKLNSSNKL